jgi:hypothetical protein
MTIDGFRKLALTLPESAELAHGGHPDFRVGKRVFASLGYPDCSWAVVKLAPAQQSKFIRLYPQVFVPVKGIWGAQGSTQIKLRRATRAVVWPALVAAWHDRAPRKLVDMNPMLPAPT